MNSKNSQRGVIIVEATLIFPMVFFVLFFLLFFGNMYYQKSLIESAVTQAAIQGAAQCTDPMLSAVIATGKVPTEMDVDVQPYRYLFGGQNAVERSIKADLDHQLKSVGSGLFSNMEPKVAGNGARVKWKNYVFCSSFCVEVEYEIKMPWRFLFSDEDMSIPFRARAEVSVNDSPEFLRNTDMAIDYLAETKAGKAITSMFAKVNEFLKRFGGS